MYHSTSGILPSTGAALSGAALLYTGVAAFSLIMCGLALLAMGQYVVRSRRG